MRVFAVVALFIVCVTGVYAIVPSSPIYSAVSEAERYAGASNATCQSASFECSDAQYSASDVYSVMGDGSTSASSGASIRNSTNSQTAYLRLTFDLDDILVGQYFLRFYGTSTNSWRGAIALYVNETNVNTSGIIYFNTTNGEWWEEIDISQFIRAVAPNRRFSIRVYALDSTAQTLTEAYLKRPPKPFDFQVIDQGVHIARVGAYVQNEWLVVTPEDAFRISNATCSIVTVFNEPVNVTLNVSTIPGQGSSPDSLRVFWYANESYVAEGRNYEISCDADFNGVRIDGIKQYVYITQEGSAEMFFQKFFVWLKSLFGTLTVQTTVIDRPIVVGVAQPVIVEVLREKLPVQDAVCAVSLYDTNMTKIADNVSMSWYVGGYYNYTFVPLDVAYTVESTCWVNTTENVSAYRASGVVRSGIATVDQIYEGIPTVDLLSQRLYGGFPGSIVVRLAVGSNDVTNAQCNATVYDEWLEQVMEGSMVHVERGLYQMNWTPAAFGSSNYPVQVVCVGGSLGVKVVRAAAAMTVETGVVMQVIS
jgi:hypothetical protein